MNNKQKESLNNRQQSDEKDAERAKALKLQMNEMVNTIFSFQF